MNEIQHIERSPDKCGGKPCVSGTRIRVWDIYILHERQQKSPDEIVAAFPQLSLADVHAALAYYWDNQDAIERQMKASAEFVAQVKAEQGPGPLAKKLSSAESGSDQVSP